MIQTRSKSHFPFIDIAPLIFCTNTGAGRTHYSLKLTKIEKIPNEI